MTDRQFAALVRLVKAIAKITYVKGLLNQSEEGDELLESMIEMSREVLVDEDEDWKHLV
jgi:hypothetical protein